MTAADKTPSSIAADEQFSPRDVLHWYDFLCPFCYVGQGRNEIFERHGFRVIDMPFEAHPDIPAAGRSMSPRSGPMYDDLEAEARAEDLPLIWPARLPNTRMALAAVEWTRRHAPQAFPVFEKALFAAHFALGEDLGDRETIMRHAADSGVDTKAMAVALDDGTGYRLVDRSEALARGAGVRGTPAWFVPGRLITGLYPKEQFERLARTLATT
ncbi:MAG: DsbA family oxidoreductase [Rhodospirillaceae bacterium]